MYIGYVAGGEFVAPNWQIAFVDGLPEAIFALNNKAFSYRIPSLTDLTSHVHLWLQYQDMNILMFH